VGVESFVVLYLVLKLDRSASLV